MEARAVAECRRGKREGDGAVVLGIWKWRADVCGEAFRCAGYVARSPFFTLSLGGGELIRTWVVEMKLITAAIYTNFSTHIVDDEGIEQVDAYTAGPRGDKLVLSFERVE